MPYTAFPANLDTFTNPASSDFLDSDLVPHHLQHGLANDALFAIQSKLGVDGSAVASSLDYLLKNSSSINPGHRHTALINPAGTTQLSVDAQGVKVTGVTSNRVLLTDANAAVVSSTSLAWDHTNSHMVHGGGGVLTTNLTKTSFAATDTSSGSVIGFNISQQAAGLNRRISVFLDGSSGTYGFYHTYSGGVADFVVNVANNIHLRVNSLGQLQVPTTGLSAGLLLGGDVLLWRSAADTARSPDNWLFEGTLGVGVSAQAANTRVHAYHSLLSNSSYATVSGLLDAFTSTTGASIGANPRAAQFIANGGSDATNNLSGILLGTVSRANVVSTGGTVSNAFGLLAEASYGSSAGTVSNLIGIRANLFTSSATVTGAITNAWGLDVLISHNTSSVVPITTQHGIRVWASAFPNATTTTHTGIFIESPGAGGGTVNANIGLRFSSQTRGTTNYCVYINDQSAATTVYPVFFAGTGTKNGIYWGTGLYLYAISSGRLGLNGQLEVISASDASIYSSRTSGASLRFEGGSSAGYLKTVGSHSLFLGTANTDQVEINTNGLLKVLTNGSNAGVQVGTDTQIFRHSADVLGIPDRVLVLRTSATDIAYSARLSADTADRAHLTAGGVLNFGDGTVTDYANLYYSGGDLKTDDGLIVSGQTKLANGSVSAPAYSFSGETNLGFWRVGTGIVGLSIGGVQSFQFDNNRLVIGTSVATGSVLLDLRAAAGNNVGQNMRSGTLLRWATYSNNDTESGSNAGSNYEIRRYSDAGSNLGVALGINRATGNVNLAGSVYIGSATTVPLGLLHLGAGTSTVPSLLLTTSASLTTPMVGALEFDGLGLSLTLNGPTRKTFVFTDGSITGTASNVTGVVSSLNGGTGFSSYTKGDLLAASASGSLSKLGVGGDGSFLMASASAPLGLAWQSLNTGHLTDFVEAVQDTMAFSTVAGSGIAAAYDDAAGLMTVRAKRTYMMTLMGGQFTPAATGNEAVLRMPPSASDGTTVAQWRPRELFWRCEGASAGSSRINIHRYTGTGVWSGSSILSSALTMSGSGTYEAITRSFSVSTINSGDKFRLVIEQIDSNHTDWLVEILFEEA